MKGVTELLKEHQEKLKKAKFDKDFLSYHLTQIEFLQHERLIHLIVMLFVILCSLMCFVLFLTLKMFMFLVLFILLMILTVFYIFHYYKLENTVIEWYFLYNDNIKKGKRS
jgi:hypothetical protein